jgi:hypothetical protein
MKYFEWSDEKNEMLKKERDISFEEVILAIEKGKLIDRRRHPNKNKYPNQFVFIVEIIEYVYVVQFVEDEGKIFLKTIYPDRKLTKKYLGK